MNTALEILGWATLLGLVQLFVTVPFVIAQFGFRYAFSPRDEAMQLTGFGGRVSRAFKNFLETFPLFVAAVLFTNGVGIHSSTALLGAQIYLVCRLLYIPILLAGIPVVRTLVWTASIVGIVMVLLPALTV